MDKVKLRPFWRIVFIILAVILALALALAILWYLAKAGKVDLPIWIRVSGTSMEPTLHNNERVKFYFYFDNLDIHRGDVVVFSNTKTTDDLGQKVSYVKRVIAMPGEEVLLQDGFIRVNGKVLDESYIKLKKSTYSEAFTPECKKVIVPKDSYFVLGDNRADSKDSRDFGFIKKDDIKYIIFFKSEIISHNFSVSLKSEDIISGINAERTKNGLSILAINQKLNQAANLRALSIANSDDWTKSAKVSNFSYEDALDEVGYSNILTAEIFDGGYLNSSDLFASWHKNKDLTDVYLNPKFQDVGVAINMGNFGDCTVPVVSAIFGGYEQAEYKQEIISSWQNTLNNLQNISVDWQKLKNEPDIYKNKKEQIDRINEIIASRIQRIDEILAVMNKKQWLSDEQKSWLDEDSDLASEQNILADEINNYINSL